MIVKVEFYFDVPEDLNLVPVDQLKRAIRFPIEFKKPIVTLEGTNQKKYQVPMIEADEAYIKLTNSLKKK